MSLIHQKKEGFAHKILNRVVQPEDKKEDWYVSDNYYDWYYTIGAVFQPKSILELGVRYGYSLICLVKGSIDSDNVVRRVYGVDFDRDALDIAEKSFKKLFQGFVKPKFLCQQTHATHIGQINDKPVDLIHLDAMHTWHVIGEIEIAMNLLAPGGVLVIDDVSSFETNTDFIRMKKQYLDATLWELVYKNEITSIEYLNTFRGTYVVTKS